MTTNIGVGGGGNFAFSMDGNGIMTKTGDASFHGVMSMDKSMIVATDTNGGNPEIWVMMKTATASTADMVGDWVMHSVSSGNSGSRGWTYGHSVVDASGNDTFSEMMGSGGPVDNTTQMTFQMNGGVMTMGGTGGGDDGRRHDGRRHDGRRIGDRYVPRDHERGAEHHGLDLFGWQRRISFLDPGEVIPSLQEGHR